MLLAVDIGNTNIVLGLVEQDKIKHKFRLKTELDKNNENYAIDIVELFLNNSIDFLKIKGVIVTSVVPSLTNIIVAAIQKVYHGKIITLGDQKIKLGIDIKLPNKSEIGEDRLVNAIAAYKKYQGNLIIVDFGTATTFDVIGDKGQYLGGVIAPGINLSIKSLHDMTAKLPQIKVKKQNNVIGKSTYEAMNSGIYFGYISMIEGMISRIKQEYGKEMKIIFTGGLATLFEDSDLTIDHYDPDLTLTGLQIIYQKNTI